MSEELILDEIEANMGKYIEFLRNLIQAESYNPPGNENNVALLIEFFLKEYNIPVEVFPFGKNRANLITYLKDNFNTKNLLYNAHMDVVPPGNEADWKYPPLSAYIKRKKLIFGRGSSDMKSALAAMVISISILKKLNINLSGNLIVNAVADEETGGILGTKWCLENILIPRKIKGDLVIVGEPSGLAPLPKAIILGEKGHLIIKVIAKGKSAHSMVPDMGINAISMMSKIIENLENLDNYLPKINPPFSLEKLKDLVSVSFAKKEDFDRLFNDFPLLKSFLENLTKLTKSLNMIKGGIKENIIPDRCEASIDFRLLPGQNSDLILKALKKMINSIGYKIINEKDNKNDEIGVELQIDEEGEPSVWLEYEDSEAVQVFKKIVDKVYKKKSFFCIAPGSTDAHYYRNSGYCKETIHFGPGKATLMHAINENVEIEDFINSIKVYTLFAYKYIK